MAEMVQASHRLEVATKGKGFVEITGELTRWLESVAAEDGLLTVFVSHTSASLTIQENADPNVRRDLADAHAAEA
jgi:secondary thiamine-phosphate synthase enzyme